LVRYRPEIAGLSTVTAPTAVGSEFIRYRPDIDGLRALAVLMVIVYHALPSVLRGGFSGVDVFFVISGFLISGQIFAELETGRFVFAAFYGRRVRRIFPALCLVLLATLGYGFVVLLPVELAQLGADVVGGAGFISNLMLWNEAGYFDRAAIYKPLLHLWSLGVEEQYYIVWPVALWVLYKTKLNRLGFVIAFAAGSFALNTALAAGSPTADFYSPLSRFWELSAGALLAWQQLHSSRGAWRGASGGARRGAISIAGVALILGSSVALSPQMHFPGWLALAPVVGAVLLIAAGPEALVNRSLLSRRVAVFTGRISYPLYLWHWPLISYAYFLDHGRELKTFPALCVIVASFFLAWVTYLLIEQPLRFGGRRKGKTLGLVACMLAVGGIGAGVWAEHGFPCRFHGLPHVNVGMINVAVRDGIFKSTPHMRVSNVDGITVAEIGQGSPILFTGDSVLYQYGPRVEQLYVEGRLHHAVYFVVGPSCAPFPGVVKTGVFANCNNMPSVAARVIAEKAIGTIVIGALWQGYFGGDGTENAALYAKLEVEVAKLRASGHKVYLVMPVPTSQRFDPMQMVSRSLTGFSVNPMIQAGVPVATLKAESASISQSLAGIARRTGSLTLDPLPDVCGTGPVCSAFFADGEPKFADSVHLRPVFVRSHIRFLDPLLIR
jgi:peptidoglycan/LPS O-acetylase OafA/YrhL